METEEIEKPAWIQALKAGDAAAYAKLEGFVRRRVLRTVRTGVGVNLDEVLADTLSTVWLSIKSLRDDSKLFSFVTTIARRVASQRRRETVRFAALPEEEELPEREPAETSAVEEREVVEKLSAMLRGKDQPLFRLLYVTGATHEEARDRLQLSPGALRKRKHRISVQLRCALRGTGASRS